MKNWLYILYSSSLDKFYVGSTHDLDGRMRRHLSNHSGYTSAAKDWQLVYQEGFTSREGALQRERQIKNWKNKNRIRELIARGSVHPDT